MPRIKDGGSQGGTVIADPAADASTKGRISPDSDRLYASVDELMFKQPATGTGDRPVNTGITRDNLEKIRFFLTTHSNAPEVTMFNTPRVSMWPEWKDPAKRTLFDRTIAFCATVQGKNGPLPITLPAKTHAAPRRTTPAHLEIQISMPTC